MPKDVIDELEIKVVSDASDAQKKLNNLANSLEALSRSVQKLESIDVSSFSSSFKSLTSSLSESKTINSKNYTSIVRNLNRFTEVDTKSLNNVASSLSSLNNATDNMSVSTNAVDSLNALGNSMSRLGNKNAERGINNIPIMFNALKGIGNIEINTTGADGLANLSNAVARLGSKNATQGVKNIPALAKQLSSINAFKFSFEGSESLAGFVKSISKFGSVSIKRAIENIPKLTIELEKMLNTLSRAPAVSESTSRLFSALSNLSIKTNLATNGANKLNKSVKTMPTHANKANNSFKGLAYTFGKFYANCFLLIRAVKALGNAVKSSMDYMEEYNFFDVATSKIGEKAKSDYSRYGYENAEAYASSFASRLNDLNSKMSGTKLTDKGTLVGLETSGLGVNPTDLLRYEATISQITDASGLLGESTLAVSKAMTMLSADMSSLRNQDLSEVMQNFQSALIGQSRAVYKYGIDITSANLAQTALRYGIQKSVSEMSQSEKIQLRTLTILEQSKMAYGDLARTINSPSNQLRILKNNTKLFAQSLGSLLLPVVQKSLILLNGLFIALRRLTNKIAEVMHLDLSKMFADSGVASAEIDEPFEDLADDSEKVATNVGKTTTAIKELKREILGFDKITKLSDFTSSNSSNGSIVPSGLGGDGSSFDLTPQINDALSDYEKKWNDMFDEMNDSVDNIADKISNFARGVVSAVSPVTDALKNLWDNGLSKVGSFVWDTLGDFYNDFLVPVGKWTIGEGLPRFIDCINKGLMATDWNRLRDSLDGFYKALASFAIIVFDNIISFYEHFLSPLSSWVLGKGLPQLIDIVSNFVGTGWTNMSESLTRLYKALEPFAEKVGQGVIDFFRDLMSVIDPIIKKGVPVVIDAMSSIFEWWNKIDANGKITSGLVESAITVGISIKAFELLTGTAVMTPMLNSIGTIIQSTIGQKLGTVAITVGIAIAGFQLIRGILNNGRDGASDDELADGIRLMVEDWFGKNSKIGEVLGGITFAFTQAFTNPKQVFDDFIKSLENLKERVGKILPQIGDLIVKGLFNIPVVGDVLALITTFIDDVITGINKVTSDKKGKDGVITGLARLSLACLFSIPVVGDIAEKVASFINNAIKEFNKKSGEKKDKSGVIKGLARLSLACLFSIPVVGDIAEKVASFINNAIKEFNKKSDKKKNKSGVITGLARLSLACLFSIPVVGDIAKKVADFIDNAIKEFNKKSGKKKNKGGVIKGLTRLSLACLFSIPVVGDIAKAVATFVDEAIKSLNSYLKKKGLPTINISKIFKVPTKQDLKNVFNALAQIFTDIINTLMGLINKHVGSITVGKKKITLFKIPKFKAPKFDSGGFPDAGQIFIANETMGNPEMVGTINGRSAVANSTQITTAIAQAVAPSVYNAVSRALKENTGKSDVNVTLEGDATKLFKVIQSEGNRYKTRTGRNPF